MPRRDAGDWVSGIEQHRQRFRFKVGVGAESKTYSFDTREQAEKEQRAAIRAQERLRASRELLNWDAVIVKYIAHETERGKAGTLALQVVEGRLRRFFAPVLTAPVQLTQGQARHLYRELRTRPCRSGQPVSVQEHHHCLSRAKALGAWLVKEKIWKDNPLAEIERVGRPKAGEESKPQLNRDALRQLVSTALVLGEQGDAGAAATLCASLLGLRASTIANRRTEHLDDNGRILKATAKGKTVELSLVGQTPDQERIMVRLRRVLALQARGKTHTEPLIGTGHDRWWVRREVRRLCTLAGVRIVPPHGLRGTHASVGRELGISPAILAGALAHSEAVQEQHYATPRAVAAGQQARVLAAIQTPKAGE